MQCAVKMTGEKNDTTYVNKMLMFEQYIRGITWCLPYDSKGVDRIPGVIEVVDHACMDACYFQWSHHKLARVYDTHATGTK